MNDGDNPQLSLGNIIASLPAVRPELTKRLSDTHKEICQLRQCPAGNQMVSVNLAKRPPRDRNRPDFVYGKPCRIDKMSENHRLLGFPTRFADPVFLCCPLMRIREAFRYFWP